MWKQPGEKPPEPGRAGGVGRLGERHSPGRSTAGRCSSPARRTWPSRPTSPASPRTSSELPGWGWYERDTNLRGTLLPQQITEFTNAGLVVGIATVNMADDPMNDFNGFWGACSTYGSFSYLKYGPMRLFSQLAQDCELKVGKVLWVAGHSGPETAEDCRTHFGIFETGVTQLFPEGHVIDLHPWEYNEVPVVLAAALASRCADRGAAPDAARGRDPGSRGAGHASHFEAARGAYVMRPASPDAPSAGTVFVQGTITTANLVKVLPQLDERGLNVKIVACISPAAVRHAGRTTTASAIRVARRPLGRHGRHQPRLQADARLDRRPAGARVLALAPTGTTAGAPAARSTR